MWCIVKVQGALKSMCSSDIQSWTKHCLLLTRCCLLITLSHLGGLPRPLLGNIFLKIFPRLSSIIIFHFLFLVINNSNQLNKLDQNLIFFSIFVWKKSLPFKSQLEILYFMSWHGLIVDTGITWFNFFVLYSSLYRQLWLYYCLLSATSHTWQFHPSNNWW